MKKLGLYKKEKLCSARAIEQLFGTRGADFAALSYPLRLVARRNPRRSSDAPMAFLITIPKKRLHHAVDRVLMRRRTREAYRLHHRDYELAEGIRLDAAFIYVADKTVNYGRVERAMMRLLSQLSKAFPPGTGTSDDEKAQ